MTANVNPTTVLITGAAGFLGSHCVEYWLQQTDWHIVAVDSFGHRGKLERLVDRGHERLKIIGVDLRGRVTAALARHAPDIIVNVASESHVDRSIENPAATWHNNTSLILNMLEFARHCGDTCRLFVQTSTDEVYGPTVGGQARDFREWDTVLPSNPYAASKAAQEALAIAYWRTYGVPVVITNCVNMFGERQHPEKYLAKVVKKLLARQVIEVHADSRGVIGSRCWTHAKNYADLVMFLADPTRPPAMFASGAARPDRWHVAGQETITNLEIVKRAADILEVRPLIRVVDAETARPGHDTHYGLDGGAIAAAGWKYPFELEASFDATVRWYAANPAWLAI